MTHIHRDACQKYYDLHPSGLAVESFRIAGIFILPFKRTVSAHREDPDRVKRLLTLLLQDSRSHAERKLIHPYPEHLRSDKMPELMRYDQDDEKHYDSYNCYKDVHYFCILYLLTCMQWQEDICEAGTQRMQAISAA